MRTRSLEYCVNFGKRKKGDGGRRGHLPNIVNCANDAADKDKWPAAPLVSPFSLPLVSIVANTILHLEKGE